MQAATTSINFIQRERENDREQEKRSNKQMVHKFHENEFNEILKV